MRYLLTFLLFCVVQFCNGQVKSLTLSDLAQRMAKGKDTTYFVNFWATWCSACVSDNDTEGTNGQNDSYVQNAVNLLLQGKKPAVSVIKVIDCSINWKKQGA